ncbi:plasmid mobilization protein [Fodinibius sediminis]|uniref:Mobilisation protein (MobC) n=1 Tax=Fodinibius sediminis TaxID=1214077 RepID=A0A521AVJ6_9BACT|nr:hypothetical protein [Fodinibius sediminis]SMO38839.1 hypothetical protein SAMN06265218_101414 [Fodinibius sediminis]
MTDNGSSTKDPDQKLDQLMKLYVTKEEKLELVDMADTIGISFSSFARAVLLEYEIEEDPVEIRKLRYQANKIGVNVNQLAKVANQQGQLPARQQLDNINQQIINILNQL